MEGNVVYEGFAVTSALFKSCKYVSFKSFLLWLYTGVERELRSYNITIVTALGSDLLGLSKVCFLQDIAFTEVH